MFLQFCTLCSPLKKRRLSNLQRGGVGTSRGCRRPWAGRDAAAALHDGGTSWPDRSGAPARAPPFVAPHQPRVDFRLWFYGLSYRRGMPAYVATLLERLCTDPEAIQPWADEHGISGDYAGFAQTALQTRNPGAIAMFFAGCGGDAAKITFCWMRRRRGISTCSATNMTAAGMGRC